MTGLEFLTLAKASLGLTVDQQVRRRSSRSASPRNHPLPDGNKRLARQSLTVFLALNGVALVAEVDDAVAFMLEIAAGEIARMPQRPGSVSGSRRTGAPSPQVESELACHRV